ERQERTHVVPAWCLDLNSHSPRHVASTQTREMATLTMTKCRRTRAPAAVPASVALSTPNVSGK
ncbi:MAG TPA: hypothetical protein VN677_15135, partial [Gemmatimonadaceae bacterium]|nr:hypothetical protein [Gemmatimonadaceae bacterium]